MTPTWEKAPAAPLLRTPLLMDAVLHPHRSLSLGAFRIMLGVAVCFNAILAAFFRARGAFPVAGFLGLDVLALWLAFRVNYRAAHVEERVRVSHGRVHVQSVGASGETTHWTLNPIWARVLREGKGVLVRAGRSQIRVGAFLSPAECVSFAAALDDALHRAKRGG